MDKLLQMYEVCASSPAYIHLEGDGRQEGFVNGWAWAQATARECLALRELPVLAADYGPAQRCGNCKWFVQHYRYTGSYPWYALVGCGHCIDPERDKRKRMQRNPVWRGCTHWRPGG